MNKLYKKNKNTLCSGCRSYDKNGPSMCEIYSVHLRCPCVDCLVKTSCNEGCDSREKWAIDVKLIGIIKNV